MTAISEDNRSVELSIGRMTCASCAAQVEKKLNRHRRHLRHLPGRPLDD
jgi:cation transport ATPase